MKILNEEHFENITRYAESIGDTSLRKCLQRFPRFLQTFVSYIQNFNGHTL